MARPGRVRLPTPSMAVSMVALMVALGGTSYAVVKLPPRSVGAKELKPNAVSGVHVKSNAITAAKVKDGSLSGKDINEAGLARVPSAVHAATADQAVRSGAAGGLDRIVYRVAVVTVPQAPGAGVSSEGVATARCDPGQLVVGGGVKLDDNMSIVDSYPETAASWTSHVNNDDDLAAHNATVYAVCIAASVAG